MDISQGLVNMQQNIMRFLDEHELLHFMSEPTDEVRSEVESLDGEILVLGAGGKMGPTLCNILV